MSVTEEASQAAATASDAAPQAPGDEQGGLSLTATPPPPPLSDPAILAVNPKFRYGKEELLMLREAPLSQRKPDFLNINEVSTSIWNTDRKKSETPTENGTRPGDIHDQRRRPGDPRERLRKENDGIVLSPQRRSFNSGCFVPVREVRANATNNNRPHSPLGSGGGGGVGPKNDPGHPGVREIQPSTRRIGSGRIIRESWDFDKQEQEEYNFRPQQRNDNQERRSFGRDFDIERRDNKDKDRRSGSNNRFGDRRRMSGGDRDEEPEWFSSGPISQNDTIELRGFDESERLGKKKMSPSQAKRARDWYKKKSEVASVTEEKDEICVEEGPGGRSTPTPQAGDENCEDPKSGDKTNKERNDESGGDGDGKQQQQQQRKPQISEKAISDQSFIFDDILKSDSIPGIAGLLTNGVGGEGDINGKSRFSKWFSVDANNMNDSRRSSMQDNSIINNLIKDISETSVSIPGDSDSYFAPISPAANTGSSVLGNSTGQMQNSKSVNIMEMLQRGKSNDANLKSQIPGRIMNLVELEAKMMQNTESQLHKHQPKTEDITEFNRLLAHISANQNGPLSQKSQPMSLMEMLSHSQQQDEARMAQLLGPVSPGATPHDIASRLQAQQKQQHQAEMLSKLMNAGIQVRASPLPEMGPMQSHELLSRPEAQAILQGLKVGDITPQHLYQQLANPALQPRHREMLVTILKLQGGGGGVGPSPRVLSPVAPHPMFQQQQQQQLRVSPLPPTAIHQRIPSPRELQVHTQNILQRALIKKKLEEQQENYRKKQEMQQRGQSPNNNNNNNNNAQTTKSVSSPTPLAFTPTSVLRKMTAEKEEGGKDVTKLVDGSKMTQGRAVTGMRSQPGPQQQPQPTPQQQQQQPIGQWQYNVNMKQAGRAIVKANSYQSQQQQQQPEQFFSQQQQQKIFRELQQAQMQQRNKQQQQFQGCNLPGGPGHVNHPQYPSANQQFSQLRAQHQQHARPANVQQNQTQGQQPQQQGHPQMGFGNQSGNASWQQFLNPQQGRGGQVGRGGLNDGDLSPTSNQLTRWFSPELLERARGGELPSTVGLSQHVLSLEEIERITAPPVHN